MQIFVRASGTRALHVRAADTVADVKARVQDAEGLPAAAQRLVFAGRDLRDGCTLAECGVGPEATLSVLLRLRGGKGGFGALLRGAGRAAQTENQDAMRDLSGRRLRHVNAEKKLQDWAAEARKRAAEAAEGKRLRELERQAVREARKQVSMDDVREQQAAALAAVSDAVQAGLAGRKRDAAGGADPGAAPPKRARGALPLDDAALSSGSDSEGSADGADALTGAAAFQPQRPAPSGLSDSCVAVIAAAGGGGGGSSSSSGSEQQALPAVARPDALAPAPLALEHQASTPAAPGGAPAPAAAAPPALAARDESASAADSGPPPAASAAPAGERARSPGATPYPPVDLEAYAGPDALQALGADGLKAELARRGLKAGGTLAERAGRLWLLRHTPRERLPRKLLSKPAPASA